MSDDDEFGADPDFLAAFAAVDPSLPSISPPSTTTSKPRIVQPVPQLLDPRPPITPTLPKVTQPIPQSLPTRSSGSSILVSPRQKGNPILLSLRSQPWEYSDIPADYVLGLTTCALFLSLKYHRLHPEYIYTRIRGLAGKYALRVLLVLVDITNHEEPLKELSKTSLINNVTVILCWSAAEGARYLELYKSFEHAAPAAIMGVQARSWSERMVEFVTVPRGINKTDAVAVVSALGSVRAAVNARPEEVAALGGWGEKKVRRWTEVVREPFRVRKAARRGMEEGGERGEGRVAVPLSRVPLREMGEYVRDSAIGSTEQTDMPQTKDRDKGKQKEAQPKEPFQMWDPGADSDEEEALIAAAAAEEERIARRRREEQKNGNDELSGAVAAALERLRKE